MSDLTRGPAEPTRQRARLTVRVSAAGVLVLLVLLGAGAQGRDHAESDLRGADFSRHDIDARVPTLEARGPTRFLQAPSSGCMLDPRYLPRTPDAVDAWYRGCRSDESRDSKCVYHPRHLPRTPDAAEAWIRNCVVRP